MTRVPRLLRSPSISLLTLFLFTELVSSLGAGEEQGKKRPRGTRLFFRAVGAESNAPILPKTRSAWTQDRQTRTGNTGMADEGFTEYPFCFGKMDFSFVEKNGFFPRFVSGAQADEGIVNTADIVLDHVYEADGCVWGLTGREFVQTFTATRPELVSITLLVASTPGRFRAALVEGGPGGRQIGPAKPFYSGHSLAWGHVRWTAGQAPLVPGRTYGIRIWREDGETWMPYLHATGNAYDGGLLYLDGHPRPESDLAVQILEEPVDVRRGVVEGADADGWVYDTTHVTFIPRTPNVRMLTFRVTPVHQKGIDLVVRVWSDDGRLVAGPKVGLAAGPEDGERWGSVVFDADELPVTPGKPYRVAVFDIPHHGELPDPDGVKLVPRDIQLRVYGDSAPGALPGIFNLRADCVADSKLRLTWSEPFPCPTTIETHGPGPSGNTAFPVASGVRTRLIEKLWSGHVVDFRLTSTGPTGLTWRTPLYRVRMPRSDVEPISQSPPYPKAFVTLAPKRLPSPPDAGPLRYHAKVKLVNPGFEDGFSGWDVTPAGIIDAPDVGPASDHPARRLGVSTKWGTGLAGFTHVAGANRQQVFAKAELSQTISTEPGHAYAVAAMVRTAVKGGPRGDTRVRLFTTPPGAPDDARDETQWFWTDGRWMRFQHGWIAGAKETTIGFEFFRWRDIDQADAYVDHVHVYDLGPAAAGARDPYGRRVADPFGMRKREPGRVLVDPRVEADGRVEAFLEAPPGTVITGIGARAHYDNITTMWLRIQPLLPDGTLGPPEEMRGGWEPDAPLEARVELPAGHVATGFGAGIAPEWDVKRLRVWARPLAPDGSLGEETEFRGGMDRESGVEKQVRLEPGRVLTSAGLNCMSNDVNRIKAHSARLIRTAASRVRGK